MKKTAIIISAVVFCLMAGSTFFLFFTAPEDEITITVNVDAKEVVLGKDPFSSQNAVEIGSQGYPRSVKVFALNGDAISEISLNSFEDFLKEGPFETVWIVTGDRVGQIWGRQPHSPDIFKAWVSYPDAANYIFLEHEKRSDPWLENGVIHQRIYEKMPAVKLAICLVCEILFIAICWMIGLFYHEFLKKRKKKATALRLT
jgi:hypothetical protein